MKNPPNIIMGTKRKKEEGDHERTCVICGEPVYFEGKFVNGRSGDNTLHSMESNPTIAKIVNDENTKFLCLEDALYIHNSIELAQRKADEFFGGERN